MSKLRLSNSVYVWALVFFLVTTVLRWRLHPDITILFYYVGAIIGLHMLEIAELIFKAPVSPFRTMLMQLVAIIMGLFVLTSSDSRVGAGVVLFLNWRYFYLQYSQYLAQHNLTSWLGNIKTIDMVRTEKIYLTLICIALIIQTVLFVLI